MADQLYNMLTGDVTDLPPKESNIVRIFTSSTFTDTFEERNKLMKDVYPSLRTYCQQHSLEFQVVDMRWGVRDEATADHKTTELCIEEIKTCKRLTPGPNYVCFLGNKYGYRPFPCKIAETEFDILVETARNNDKIAAEEVDLLLEWFLKDTNAIPSEYVLQPVTSKLLHYMDMRDEVKELYKREREQWWNIFTTFQRVLRIAAREAGNQGKLTSQTVHKYFKSVTEDEVEHGILNSPDAKSQTLCYVREIEDIHVNLDSDKTPLYTDFTQGQHDIEAQEHLDRLKRQRILNKLGESNVTHYSVPWKTGGINANDRRHQEYLREFCDKFESDIQRLIDRSLDVMRDNKIDQNPLFKEVLHHAWFCRDKCSAFRGRQAILNRVKAFLSSDVLLKPLVIYGTSGSGKTSIMAVIVSNAKHWLGKTSVCVFRFLGTSPDTSNIVVSLTSIIRQIHEVYDLGPLKEEIAEDFSQLVRHFHDLLQSPEITSEKPLLLVIDSIDQLTPSYNAHLMNWLPKSCQPNVKIIISVLPGYYDILPTLRRRLRDDECYIEVPSLTKETGHEILDAWLEGSHRCLTESQRDIVMKAFIQCPQPLFLKLIYTEASQWCSYTDVSGVNLGASVKEAITLLFERIERKHGKVLVSHALGYITAARHGLTENELEDILSLDDDVIDDVYQYWDPPVEGVVRLPNLLWARIRHDINEFFVERQADKKTIVTWYHRQFWESAELRYLSNREERISRHALMCEYFQGSWGGGCKKHITLTRRKKALPDADRQVASQPLLFAKDIYNLRKLSETPYHFVKAEKREALKNEVLFNFEWINAKIHGQSLNDVLEDYDNALRDGHDMEIRLAKETLVLASSNIKNDPDSLAPQIIARMLAFKDDFPHIATLINHACRWCYARNTPFFIPLSPCLISAGGPLITNLHGHTQRVNSLAVTRDNNLLVTSGEDGLVNVWNQGGKGHNHDCLHTFKMADKGTSSLVLTPDDTRVAASIGRELGVWNLDTGENLQKFKSEGKVNFLNVTPDGSHVVAGCDDGVIRLWDIREGGAVKDLTGHEGPINSITFDVNGHVVSASKDSTVRVWDIKSGESIQVFKGHTKPVLCLVVTGNGKTVVSGSEDKQVKLWNLESRDCVTLKGHTGLVKCLAAMHDGTRIVSGSKDQLVKVWHLTSLKCLLSLKGHYDLIWALTVSQDDHVIVSASKDDMLRVWRSENGECIQTLIGHSSWISCVAMTPDCDVIISGSNDKNIKLWNALGNEHAQELSVPSDHFLHHKTQPEAVAMTTDGQWGVTGAKDDEVKIWDIRQQEFAHSFPGSVSCVTKTSSLPYAVTGSHNGTVTMFDCSTPSDAIARFETHEGNVTKVLVLEGDSGIVSAGADGTVRIRDLSISAKSRTVEIDGDDKERVLSGHSNAVTCVVVLKDRRHILTGSKDSTIKLWDMNSCQCDVTYTGHQKDVACLVATADSKTFVSGSTDFTVRIWSTNQREETHKISEYNDSITDIVMTTDDRCFIAGSHESKLQLRMWDIKTGSCAKVFHGHTHAIMRLKIAHAHNMLLSSSRDGTVKAWDLASGNMLNSFDFQSQVKHFDFAPVGEGDSSYSFIAVTKSGTVGIMKFWNPHQCAVAVQLPENVSEAKKEIKEEKENDREKENEEQIAQDREENKVKRFKEVEGPVPSNITFRGSSGCCARCSCCNCQRCTVL